MSVFNSLAGRALPAGLVFVVLSCLAGPAAAQRNLAAAPPSSQSEQRVALVIGNTAYQRGPLKNPVNDARAIADRLQRLGFTVIKRENLSRCEYSIYQHYRNDRIGRNVCAERLRPARYAWQCHGMG